MARLPEAITAGVTTVPATLFALYSGATIAATRSGVLHKLYNIWTDARLDFLGRHNLPNPLDNQVSEKLLLDLSGLLPERTQDLSLGLGFALNVFSLIGYATSNRESLVKNVPILGPLRPVAEIAATLSLAVTPSVLLSMIEQYRFLQTATHLGTAEAVMAIAPSLLLMTPAFLKLPSVAEGAYWVAKNAVIKPIVGVVANTIKGSENTKKRRERQERLQERLNEQQALEEHQRRRQAEVYKPLPTIPVDTVNYNKRLNAQEAEHPSQTKPYAKFRKLTES